MDYRITVGRRDHPGARWARVRAGCARTLALRELCDSPQGCRVLRRALASLRLHELGDLPDHEVARRVAVAIERGRCELQRRVRVARAVDQVIIPQTDHRLPPTPAPIEPIAEQDDWIEIEILDEKGVALASRELLLELSDGSTRTATTDGFGLARVAGLPPGPCTVTFMDIDARELRPA